MKEQIYDGGFSAIPWQLLDMISSNAYKAFGKIHQCVFMNCSDMSGGVEIATSMLERAVGNHHKTVANAIKELEKFNIIIANRANRKRVGYRINWEELNVINERLEKLNWAGRDAMFDLAKKQDCAISQLSEEDCVKICSNPVFRQKMTEKLNANDIDTTLGHKMTESQIIGSQNDGKINLTVDELWIASQNDRIFRHKMTENVIASLFDGTQELPEGFEFVQLGGSIVLRQKMTEHSVTKCPNPDFLRQKVTTDNIYKEELKEISEPQAPLKKVETVLEDFESFEEVELSPEELEEKSRARKERYAKSKERLTSISGNPYRDKPYFPRTVLEEFAGNPDECASSPVRLFIYNFFAGLFDYYMNHRYEEEGTDGSSKASSEEPYIPTFSDIEGMYVPSKDFSDIAQTAKEETEGQIEVGEFEDAYGTIRLNMTKLPAIDILSLCDWHLTDDRQGILVGTDGFRNIEADDITESPVVNDNQSEPQEQYSDKARNLQYAAFLTSADKNTLTPLERFQKQFLERFVEFDDMFMIQHFKNDKGLPMERDLSWRQFQPFLLTLLDVSKEQFFQTLYQKGKYQAGMDVKKVSSIFSYKDSQRLNKLLGFDSKATPDKLTEIRPNPYG